MGRAGTAKARRVFWCWGAARRAFGGRRMVRLWGVEGKVWKGRVKGGVTKRRAVMDIGRRTKWRSEVGGRTSCGNAGCDV